MDKPIKKKTLNLVAVENVVLGVGGLEPTSDMKKVIERGEAGGEV